MKKTFGKILSLTLAVLLTLSVFPIAGLLPSASAWISSGTCGTNVKWSLDTSTGVLKITGSGKMKNYKYVSDSKPTSAPWYSYCSYIKTVKIEDGVTSIGNRTFYNCSSLTSVNIPDGVTSIGNRTFYNCSSLTSVTIPDSVTSIGNYAFRYCSSLTSVTIGNSVTSIGGFAFDDCSSLKSVTIPDGVTSIGNFAFYGCSKLTSVTIPDSVTSIGGSAFMFCSSLKSVTIPDSVTSIGNDAFYRCSSLTSVFITDLEAWCGISFGSNTSNPLYDAHNLYLNGNKLTSLTIPDGVTSIGNYAFYDCSLTSVNIPDSVTSIGGSAFYKCSSLTSVTIGNGVTSIGRYAFRSCSSLTSVNIPDSVTSIGNCAFEYCSKLTSVILPDSVKKIGYYIFDDCSSLRKITILNPCCDIYDDWYTIPSSAVIYGYENSTAQEYANDHNRTFRTICKEHSFSSSWKWNGYSSASLFFSCKECGFFFTVKADKISSSVTTKATCTAAGKKVYAATAKYDGRTYTSSKTETLPKKAHSYGSYVTVKKATCTAKGSKQKTCTVCGKVYIASIAKKAHTYSTKWTTDKKATCTEAGSKQKTCTVCGKVYIASIAKKAHTYSTKWTTDKKATCTAAGSKSRHCTVCGAKKDVTKIPAKGHVGKVTLTKATLSKDGKRVTKCTVCGKTLSTAVIKKASKISLSTSTYVYTGNNRLIQFTVKDSSGKTLVKGTDYSVSYPTDRKSIGKHTVKITLKGNYSGTKTLPFTVVPGKVTGLKQFTYPNAKLAIQWTSVKGADGYQVQCYNNSTGKWGTIYYTSGNKIGSNDYSGSRLWRIRAYKDVDGKKYYGTFSNVLTTKT